VVAAVEAFDAVIVGAGFAGLATARVCRAAGMSVAVLERRDRLEMEGAGLALQPVGFAALERLGLLGEAMTLGQPFTVVEQCDTGGRVVVRFDYGELDHPFAQMMTVRRAELIAVLGDGVSVRFGSELTALMRDDAGDVVGVKYRDAHGDHALRAAWVVGADGRASRTRELAGIRSWGRTRPEGYVVGLVDGPCIRDQARLYCGPGWADGVLPHPGRLYFFDYINAENRAAVSRRDFDEWATIYASRIPDARTVLECVHSFDQLSVLAGRQHVAFPRVRPGIALAGDAAASVHPHSGQGANFALHDGVELGAALASRRATAVQKYGRRHDRLRRRYVPYSVIAGRTLDATSLGWQAARAASTHINRVHALRRRILPQHAGLR
jgi:monooxygenase